MGHKRYIMNFLILNNLGKCRKLGNVSGLHHHGDTSWWLFNPEIVSAHQMLFSD